MNKKLSLAAVLVTAAALVTAGVTPAQATSSVTVIAPITTVIDSDGYYGSAAVSNDGSLVAVVNEYDGATIYDVAANTQFDITNTALNESGDLGYPAFSPDNTLLYVADYDNASVIVVNLSDNSINRTISGLVDAWALTASRDGQSLYVHDLNGGNVYKVDLSNSDAVTGPFDDQGSYANTMCLSADGSTLYSPAYSNGTLAVFDTSDMSLTAQWDTGSGSEPYSCTTDNDGNMIVGLYGNGSIVKFAPDGSSAGVVVDGDPSIYGAAASCDTIYVADENNQAVIEAFDLSTLAVKASLIVAEAPSGDGFYGYSAARSLDGSVVAIGGYSNTDGLAIILSPDCAVASQNTVPALANTGANSTNVSLVASGAALFALLGTGVVMAARRRKARA